MGVACSRQRGTRSSFVPYFARYPYETYVAPRATHASIAELSRATSSIDLADVLGETLVRMDNLWRMPFPVRDGAASGADRRRAASAAFTSTSRSIRRCGSPGCSSISPARRSAAGNFLNDTAPEDKAAELRARRHALPHCGSSEDADRDMTG